jgi:pSer/pThr/pTyr-binding forkhead associated (FHA) protein
VHVIIKAVRGPGAGTRIVVPVGKEITVGRSAQADYVFSEDLEMSRVHFAIKWSGPKCLLYDLGSSNGTYLNQVRVMGATLKEGDQIRAGQCNYSVSFDEEINDIYERPQPLGRVGSSMGATSKSPVIGGSSSNKSTVPPAKVTGGTAGAPSSKTQEHGFSALPVPEICADITQLSDEAKAAIQESHTPAQFVDALTNKKLFADAIRFLAHALPKRDAVVWACNCVIQASNNELEDKDGAALRIAQACVKEPSDTNRLAANGVGEELKFATPASWVAMGAFWTEGSFLQSELFALPELPTLPALPPLTAHAVSGAIMLAALQKDSDKAFERYQQFVQMGIEMGKG